MIRALWFAPLLLLFASPCAADIYGYVDEDGVAHLSNVQVDSRYYLFKKEAPPVEQAVVSSAVEPQLDAASLALFKDDVSLALAAYHAGEGAVIGAGGKIPPYADTRSYVPKVLQLWERHRRRM